MKMSDQDGEVLKISIDEEKESWPSFSFDQHATLQIARWVLWIFSGVYLACFILSLCSLLLEGATFEKTHELIKFFINAIMPLVTLAVGYYLGDKNSFSNS